MLSNTEKPHNDSIESPEQDVQDEHLKTSKEPVCSVCLLELMDISRPDSCSHEFCFKCLKSWSKLNKYCPLCRTQFNGIYYTFNDPNVYESVRNTTNDLPLKIKPIKFESLTAEEFGELNSSITVNDFIEFARKPKNSEGNNQSTVQLYSPNNAGAWRVRIYAYKLWAHPLFDGLDDFCHKPYYRLCPENLQKLRDFILRDIVAIRTLDRYKGITRHHGIVSHSEITDTILQALLFFKFRNPFITSMLQTYIGEYSSHFMHELFQFASSCFDVVNFDKKIRYLQLQGDSIDDGIELVPIVQKKN